MSNPFAGASISAGYATARPPLHRMIVDRFARFCPGVRTAVDVGCGAGLSTRPLIGIAERCIGIDPVPAMVGYARNTVEGATFAVASAEVLPVRPGSVDLLAAAGSLNYVRLERFFPEAARALAREGVLAVYDFSAGREFPHSPDLAEWFGAFHARYPTPPASAHHLDPKVLSEIGDGFALVKSETFVLPLTLEPEFYLRYMLTETNVAAAVASGTPEQEIEAWCGETLAPVFRGRAKQVLFRGYWALLRRM